mmetsp:Transcript_29052/g.66819  ORF Transcript_29052/g.66819 Transcript_29052/m.66819 type:complete len:210 (+) Transcript_29052:89-718(+)
MAATAAVAIAVRRSRAARPRPSLQAGSERHEIRTEMHRKDEALRAIMSAYDTNHSGKLEEDQVRKLLTDLDETSPPGTAPSDEEFKFIMKLADLAGDNCISKNELSYAVRVWRCYTKKRKLMEDRMAEYDKSGTGRLSQEELKAYLVALNGGNEVQDKEVEWVLHEADVFGDGEVNTPELMLATAQWYVHVEREASKTHGNGSKACSVL